MKRLLALPLLIAACSAGGLSSAANVDCHKPGHNPPGNPCTTTTTSTPPSSSSVPSSSTTTTAPPQITIEPTTTAPSATVNVGSGVWRTSSYSGPIETVDGVTYKVIAGVTFTINGGYVYVDDVNVLFRGDHFNGGAPTSNTSALLQGGSYGGHIRVESSTFDGGPSQNRGIQSDTANLYVYGSYFHRTGNAAVEKNDRQQSSDLVISGSTVQGEPGWPPDQHVDGFQVGGARSVTISGNTLNIPTWGGAVGNTSYVANSCLGLWAELGNTGPTLVENNVMRGCGGSGMYLEQKSPYSWTGAVTVRNNRFDRGSVWFVLAPNGLPSQLTWEGNVWDDTVTTITLAEATTDHS